MSNSWSSFLKREIKKSYFQSLKNRLSQRYKLSTVYPPKDKVMSVFKLTPFDEVKVVILGQDPYHGKGQFHGLAFSVLEGVPMPPSLKNIFREVHSSMGYKLIRSGNLERWAKQGVLLLNSVMTVQAGKPGSHADLGWQQFTDNVIKEISDKRTGVVFMLWGNFSKGKAHLIDEKKHMILEASHPSPYSADRGFFGCDHFHLASVYLTLIHGQGINWK